jgi:hypothetical protein
MKVWRKLGILLTDQRGNLRIKPIPEKQSLSLRREGRKGKGKIVAPPNPEEDRISREKKIDYSLDGRLKKLKGRR